MSAETSTLLATDRTRLAHDRTLMAWVRTSTSLISFGFTIYKFFQYLREQNAPIRDRLFGPREYALLMIGVGVVALFVATLQHRREMKALRALHPEIPYSLVTLLAGFMSLIGVVTLLVVIFRQ